MQLPCPSPASGTSHALPLLLRWLTTTVKTSPPSFSRNAWASAGRFRSAESPPVTKESVFSAAVVPTGVTAAGW